MFCLLVFSCSREEDDEETLSDVTAAAAGKPTAGQRLEKFMTPFLRLSTKSRNREERDLSTAGAEQGGEQGADDEQVPPSAPPNVSNLSFLRSASMSRRASVMLPSGTAADMASAAAAASGGAFQGLTLSPHAKLGTPLSPSRSGSLRLPSIPGLTLEAARLLPDPLSSALCGLSPHGSKPSLSGDDACGAGMGMGGLVERANSFHTGGLVERANSFQMGPTPPTALRSPAVSMNGGGSPSMRRRASVCFDMGNGSSGPSSPKHGQADGGEDLAVMLARNLLSNLASAGGSDMASRKRGNMSSAGSISGTSTPHSYCSSMHQEDGMSLSRLGGASRVTADGRVRHGPVKNATQPNLGQYMHQVGRP